MGDWHDVRWNWTEFCGTANFAVWTNDHNDLTDCFQTVCLQIPTLSAIAILSAYFAGKYDEWTIRTWREKLILKSRVLITVLLAITPAVRLAVQVCDNSKSLFAVDYWFAIAECLAWFSHFCYISALKNRLGVSLRGPLSLNSLWTMFFVVCVIRTRSLYLNYLNDAEDALLSLVFATVTMLLQTLYGFTLLPSEDSTSRRTTIDVIDQEDVAFNSLLSQYARFREDFDPHYLGTALEGSGLISKFVFLWANRLMDKGVKSQLNNPDDVFDLPDELTCSNLYQKFENRCRASACTGDDQTRAYVSLIRTLHRGYAKEFYGVGILKFVADVAGFASPLLLHELLNYIDDPSVPLFAGYLYASGIFLASFIGSFSSVHFDFLIGKIGLKLQGALTSVIYRKILLLNPSVFQQTSVGEIVNHISVDMERIANSCISFHAVWSIPLQLGVTLYLLYTQVGTACLVGVACSIVLIPLNKYITQLIGRFSTRMMEEKDKRVDLMSEIIRGIRVIKLHVWEEHFVSKILGIRAEEVKYLKYRKYLDALCVFFWATTPVMLSTTTFCVYVYFGGELDAATVFTTIALLNMLVAPLNAFPWVLNGIIEAWVSVKRVDSFLRLEEIDSLEYYSSTTVNDRVSVQIYGGIFSWTPEKLLLTDIDLTIEKGQIIGISGPVGSGKSSLLFAILGEIRKMNGRIYVEDDTNGIGFVSQTPWIQQCSVRENILFGTPYDATRYKKVVEACALAEDINAWPNGDFEIVGEAGSTLSGGQKARIALARAVYQEKSIYLLDDVFSAVDGRVASHIHRECLMNLLKGTTRILVTHAVELLSSVDRVILMENGTIVNQGLATSIFVSMPVVEGVNRPCRISTSDNSEELCSSGDTSNHSISSSSSSNSIDNGNSSESVLESNKIREGTCEKDIEKEVSAFGVVTLGVYVAYWKAVGHALASFVILSVIAMQVSRVAVDWWLSVWVSANTDDRANVTDWYYLNRLEFGLVGDHASDVGYFLVVYSAIGFANSAIVIVRAFSFAYGGVRAAARIHKKLLHSVLQARMEFFQVSPLGRILNRFSSDTNVVDDALPFDINILLAQFVALIGVLVTAVYGIPWLCLFVAPLIPTYHWLQNRYRCTSRELKRVTSVVTSPLYSHVSETLSGVSVIRAFKQSPRFVRENEDKVDALQKSKFSALAAQAWLNIRLQMIGVILIGGVCLITVLKRHFDVAHSGFIGLAISYALTLTSELGGTINIFVETERKMVALERVNEYIEQKKSESNEAEIDFVLPFAWPSQGVISFANVYLKYRDEDDVAYSLKNVTFETLAGEKIGIVGRTGAGKSSIIASLFRLVDISDGTIRIDAINIADIPLKKLRSKITVIPQEPFIFADTIRNNLDPLHEREEFDIWDVISRCNLIPLISKLGGMNAKLRSDGDNLSVGEKQLLCLARAVLRNTKIVCIDEASANMDPETDRHVQDVIRNSFKSSTVFIIAHRVQSVLDCDRILVMGEGEVLEFDSPQLLLQNTDSKLYKVLNHNSAI